MNRLDVAAEGALGQVGLPADLAGMQLRFGVALFSTVSRVERRLRKEAKFWVPLKN